MNPIDNDQTVIPGDDRLLDCLVDGELPDLERRQLLLRIEKEPDGWRRCALAFLEAQTWRQALTPVAATAEAPARSVAAESLPGKRIFWRPVARLTGLAAGLVMAFALGWTYHRGLEQTTPSAGLNQQAGSVADRSIQAPKEVIKVAANRSSPTKLAETGVSIDPIVKNLQQRGYSVETQQRLVPLESKDGRKVKLPVQEFRIRYTGDRIY